MKPQDLAFAVIAVVFIAIPEYVMSGDFKWFVLVSTVVGLTLAFIVVLLGEKALWKPPDKDEVRKFNNAANDFYVLELRTSESPKPLMRMSHRPSARWWWKPLRTCWLGRK